MPKKQVYRRNRKYGKTLRKLNMKHKDKFTDRIRIHELPLETMKLTVDRFKRRSSIGKRTLTLYATAPTEDIDDDTSIRLMRMLDDTEEVFDDRPGGVSLPEALSTLGWRETKDVNKAAKKESSEDNEILSDEY